jgi:hypothetical protein
MSQIPVEEAAVEEAPVEQPAAEAAPAPDNREADMRALVDKVIQQRDEQWMTYNQQSQNQQQQYQQQQYQPQPKEDTSSKLNALYTDDETGRSTQDTISKHFKLMVEEEGLAPGVSLQDVERISEEKAGRVREQIRSGLTITNEVHDLVRSGLIAPEDINTVQSAYTQRSAQPSMRVAAENPSNAPWILKGVVYDLFKNGTIKPNPAPKRNTSPLTPGGNGTPPEKPAPIDPATSPFQSVRNMDKGKLEAARNLSKANYAKANRSS